MGSKRVENRWGPISKYKRVVGRAFLENSIIKIGRKIALREGLQMGIKLYENPKSLIPSKVDMKPMNGLGVKKRGFIAGW